MNRMNKINSMKNKKKELTFLIILIFFLGTSKIDGSLSSRNTSDDIQRLDDVSCASPDSPSCSTGFPSNKFHSILKCILFE